MIMIAQARKEAHFDSVRELMHSFLQWHYARHHEFHELIDRYFDPVKFDKELANLPGQFGPPSGRLLIAVEDENVAGCVALQDLGDGVCEMKRMFVHPEFHGRGVGRALGEAIVSEAKDIGYRVMRLDTGPKQIEAQSLYRRLGFQNTEPYYDLDNEMKNWLVFMERDLSE